MFYDHIIAIATCAALLGVSPFWDDTHRRFEEEPVRNSVENRPKVVHLRISTWQLDNEISWYGPRFFGNRTACGLRLTRELVGVAHRTLPCGTLVEFRWKGRTVVTPVVDRGPYVQGRIFDLTAAACRAIRHCFTGPIEYRIYR